MKDYEAETAEIIAMIEEGELPEDYNYYPDDMPQEEAYKRRDALAVFDKAFVMWEIRRAILRPIMEENPEMTMEEAIERVRAGDS